MFEVYYINNNHKIFNTYQDFLEDKNFNNIRELYCNDDQITDLDNLFSFDEGIRNQTFLDFLPNSLKILNLFNKQITSLDSLPAKLTYLYCDNNQITSLDSLPNSLEYLSCSNNKITSLDNLPAKLIYLRCSNNRITSLDNLPNSLKELNCDNNRITSLDNLPNSLEALYCENNQIIILYNLPNSLEELYCYNNKITSLNLPDNLKTLFCYDNKITSLNLPDNLEYYYYNNPICEIVNNYFDKDLKKYNLWKQNYLKKFVLKIENWFLECKYNPKYKYCQKFVMEGYNFYETEVSSEQSFNEKK